MGSPTDLGQRIPLQGIPREEYLATAQTFRSPQLRCDRMVSAGRGMVLLITSKHHDGFAMWDSHDRFTKQSPTHRDPIIELSQACRKVRHQVHPLLLSIDWRSGGPVVDTLDEATWTTSMSSSRSSSAVSTADHRAVVRHRSQPQSNQLRVGARLSRLTCDQLARGQRPPGLQVGWDNRMRSEQAQGP